MAHTHSAECIAKASISAAENVRDAPNAYGSLATADLPAIALGYLQDGYCDCICATKVRTCEGTCKGGYRSDLSELTSCSDDECASWVKPCAEHACYFATISSSATPTHACVVLDVERHAENVDKIVTPIGVCEVTASVRPRGDVVTLHDGITHNSIFLTRDECTALVPVLQAFLAPEIVAPKSKGPKVHRIDAQECGDMEFYVRRSDTLAILAGPISLARAEVLAPAIANLLGTDVDLVSGAYV